MRASQQSELIIICSCHTLDHAIRFSYWPDDDTLFVDVTMPPLSWWKRIAVAFRYVFTDVCPFGSYAEVVIGDDDRAKLRAWVEAVPWPKERT